MSEEPKLILEIAGLVTGMAVQTWLIIRYILDRTDNRIKDERQERLTNEDTMKKEIANFRSDHVRRDDFVLHMENVNKQIDNLATGMQNLANKFDNRMDALMTMLAGRNKDGNA